MADLKVTQIRSSIGTKPVAHREPHGPGERVVVCAVCGCAVAASLIFSALP